MNTSPHSRFTGSCLCGHVKFEIAGAINPIEICYCQMCRKASGGPLAANSPVKSDEFHITQGRDTIAAYESSAGELRHFCSRCGSPLFSTRADRPEIFRVRVGTINEPLPVRPVASYYTGSKCNWWEIRDDLPRFETE